jgi:dGTPase
VSEALKELKQFNYQFIYKNPLIKRHLTSVEDIFKYLFDKYMDDLAKENRSSVIYYRFLDGMDDTYRSNHSHAEITRDFIAGMTDSYFIRQAPDHLRPTPIDWI